MTKKKTIGIIGGMGPEATVDTFRWIVAHTNLDTKGKSDEEHIPVIIHNNPLVPSRVEAILHNGPSPLPAMTKMAQELEKIGADFLIMPCNSSTYYINQLRKRVNIPILSIVEETAAHIYTHHPGIKNIGLLATEQVIRVGVYHKELVKRKMQVIEGDPKVVDQASNLVSGDYVSYLEIYQDGQEYGLSQSKTPKHIFSLIIPKLAALKKKVTKAIYSRQGIKTGYYYKPRKLLASAANQLRRQGAQLVIMGCSEIPLVLKQKHAKVKLVNPNKILAQAAVDIATGKRKFPQK